MSSNESKTFEIGLVLAGAVSAGAYTAGVIDFLLESLENYEKVRKKFKKDNPAKPELHKVKIKVISGASAGGMCGTMLLSTLMDDSYKPMKNFDYENVKDEDIENNVFYKSWVSKEKGVDLKYLLNNNDIEKLDNINSLTSVLNCERLDNIADEVTSRFKKFERKEYIAEDLEILLSVFNLKGINFDLAFKDTEAFYRLINHSDMMNFKIGINTQKDEKSKIFLDVENPNIIEKLKLSTLATGAFPLFLQSRELSKNRLAYKKLKWWTPEAQESSCPNNGKCFSLKEPKAFTFKDEVYSFECIDGGVANNEPLELARRILAGDKIFNERDENSVNKALLMIDPFSQISKTEEEEEKELKNYLLKRFLDLFGALKNQSRFKPDEISLAMSDEIFSRFLIAPSKDNVKGDDALASSSLGAFGGFLSEKFRQHDFQLGRKNAQSFLMSHFKMGIGNVLVKDNIDWFKKNSCLLEDNGKQYIPVVPLVDISASEQSITYKIEPISFDKIKMSNTELGEIYKLIENRVDAVFSKFYKGLSSPVKAYLQLGAFLYGIKQFKFTNARKEVKSLITKMIKEKIDEELERRKLK